MPRSSFETTIDAAYQAAIHPELWPSSLAKIADFVGGDGAMLANHDMLRNKGTLVVGRLREDISDLYLERYCINPYSQAIGPDHIGRAVQANALVDLHVVRRTAFHADVVASQHIDDLLVMPLRQLTHRNNVGGISITLNQRQADFTRDRLRRFQRLAPHLMRAVDLGASVEQARMTIAKFGSLLQSLPTAAVVVDAAGMIQEMNLRGERALAASDSLAIGSGGKLVAKLDGEKLRLAAALDRAVLAAFGGGAEFQEAIHIAAQSHGWSDLVILTPLPPVAAGLFDLAERAVNILVQVISMRGAVEEKGQKLASTYGLTRSEARVAVLIASGKSSPDVAALMGISVNTVKTHLVHCYDKMGVRSQVMLARLVSAV